MRKKLTTEEFIKRANLVHGDRYNYDKVKYEISRKKIKIKCNICNHDFLQLPLIHLQGQGCPKCAGKLLTQNDWISRFKEIHGDKYDYSKINYINNSTKVCIICPEHGEFWQTPDNHFFGKHGCDKCGGTYNYTTKEFIEKVKKIQGDKYDYSKVDYKGTHIKVCIICPEHGEFWQKPIAHLHGYGCSKCTNNYNYTTEEWIEKANFIHKNRYNYDKVNYINNSTKVCIICPEHGEFWQTPLSHIQGKGCSHCKTSIIEREVMEILNDKNIIFKHNSKPFEWLKDKGKLQLDFYLPDYNIAIECQGIQHFFPISYFGGEKEFEKLIYRDKIKKKLCKKNNILLYYINYDEDVKFKIEKILKNNKIFIIN